MLYVWKCSDCDTHTEVERKVKDIDLKPDDGCNGCGSYNLKRVIVTANFSLVLGGNVKWHKEEYTTIGVRDEGDFGNLRKTSKSR